MMIKASILWFTDGQTSDVCTLSIYFIDILKTPQIKKMLLKSNNRNSIFFKMHFTATYVAPPPSGE